MGITNSKSDQQTLNIDNRFRVVEQVPDRNVSLLEERDTGRPYVLKEITFNDKEEFGKALTRVATKQKALEGDPHVVPLTEYFSRTEDHFCSNFYKIYALFEHPHKNLSDEISERQKRGSNFQEKQLWSILASCILGLCHLQNADIKHQTLRTTTILLTSDGAIMVSDPYCTGLQTNYEALLNKRNTPHIYLSPEQCRALSEEKIAPNNINAYKSDVFVMGMIMLQAGLLQPQDDCYRQDHTKLHWQSLNYNLDKFGKRYSQELKAMLEMMLNQKQDDRLEWVELEGYVRTGDESGDSMDNRAETPLRNTSPRLSAQQPEKPYNHLNETSAFNPNNYGQQYQNTVAQPVQQISQPVQQTTQRQSVPSIGHTSNLSSTVQAITNQPKQVVTRTLGGGNHSQLGQTVMQQLPQPIQQSITHPIAQPIPQPIPMAHPIPQPLVVHNAPTAVQPPSYYSSYNHQPMSFTSSVIVPAQTHYSSIPSTNFTPSNAVVSDNISPPNRSSQLSRPNFTSNLPSNTYSTITKIDENLVEVDQEDLTQTRQPDEPTNNNAAMLNLNNYMVGVSTSQMSNQTGRTGNFNDQPIRTVPPPVSTITSIYQPTTSTTYQLLQQPTDVNKFMSSWQPPTTTTATNAQPNIQTMHPSSTVSASYAPPTTTFRPTQFEPVTSVRPANLPPINSVISNTSYINQNSFSVGSSFQSPTFQTKAFDMPSSSYASINNPPTKPLETFGPSPSSFSSNIQNNVRYTDSIDVVMNRPEPKESQVRFVKETFSQGSRYEGEKVNGMRHGKGKFFYQDGGLYDGDWRFNQMTGHGKLYYQSGKIAYDGLWNCDKFAGFGTLYNEMPVPLDLPFDYTNLDTIDEYWTRFQGQFQDDLKQGPGKLFLSNGQYFQGEFERDAATGQGVFYCLNGEKIYGLWNQNQLERRLK